MSDNLTQSIQDLFGMYNQPLIKSGQARRRFGLQDYVLTPSDFQWSFAEVGCPFTQVRKKSDICLSTIQDIFSQCRDGKALPQSPDVLDPIDVKVQKHALLSIEKDAAAATLLATTHINENSFLHEVGCWNGQNLLNLLFYAFSKGRFPKYCVGTDINSTALSIAESSSSFLNLKAPFLQYYVANALDRFDPTCFGFNFENEIKLALRIIPVLEPIKAKRFLENMRRSLQCKDSVVIVSYAIPKGDMFERNLMRAKGSSKQFRKKNFSGGTVFYAKFQDKELLPRFLQGSKAPEVVLNTYFTEKAFSKLAQEIGFIIDQSISVKQDTDNERVVVVLVPK